MEATAYLAYGVDIGANRPEGLPDDYRTIYDWTRVGQISRFVRAVYHSHDGAIILAVQGTVKSTEDTPKVVSNFDVESVKVDGFKAALESIGIVKCDPRWLLALEIEF
jgi:hypothetical protein